ncbi:MAG: TrbI/VirB10 family protein [Acidobacteria bacterium]|nr:TrbI/VirB10 family protein [Acidobacteriota bacterium]
MESSDVHERLEKTSLVFVQKVTPKVEQPMPQLAVGISLAPGTKLRAKLESAVSTAVHSPAVAVIEYNYERDGQILIPAGAKAFGQLEMADRSGYVGIHFNSLLMPDGAVLGVEAVAADLHLQPLRGRVESRHAGKNILIRSFAGMGEITATVLGRGSLNQPLSEGDLFRERISSNIGQAADQSLNNSALTEQSVISVHAGTELYIILQKSTMERAAQRLDLRIPESRVSVSKTDELRQLLQLQRELNDTQPSQ